MKEATGELSMTAIAAVAIAAIAALFYTLVWPTIKLSIVNNTCSTYGDGWHAVKISGSSEALSGANASDQRYACCPSTATTYNASVCLDTTD